MAKTIKKTEVDEVRGKQADKVIVDDAAEFPTEEEAKAVEEGFAKVDIPVDEDKLVDDIQKRKQEIIDGLIGSADEKLDTELDQERGETVAQDEPKKTPATESSFQRGGAAIAGPFARKRLRPVATDKKPATPDNPRRGVVRIWEDRPINNVGDGSYVGQKRKHT